MRRLLRTLRRARPSAEDIDREIRDHLELEAEELAAAGVADAAHAARRRFGNVSLARESVRDVWRWSWLEQLLQDLRHAWRGLRRSPIYTATAVITLALGIGATVTVFSLGDTLLRRPFPLLPQDRLLWIVQRSRACPTCDNASSAALFALRERARAMDAVGAAAGWRTALRGAGGEGSELLEGYRVSANLFSVIEAPFAAGRGFAPDADRPGAERVAVLSYRLWRERFRGSRGVIDSVVTLDGQAHRVVGVLARDLVFPTAASVYVPLALRPSDANDYGSRYLDLFARLAPGASLGEARRESAVVGGQLAAASPSTDAEWTLAARPLREFHSDDVMMFVGIFAVGVALVWLAGCMSVANLTLTRTAARRRELAVRAALGGRRARLARHLLAEAALVALAGAVLGVTLATVGLRVIHDQVPASLAAYAPGWNLMRVDAHALVFTLLASAGTLLLVAALPTLRATRVPLSSVLAEGGRGSAGDVHGTRLRAPLVVLEVSVALVLLTGATLLSRSVRNMLRGDPGVRLDHVLTMPISFPGAMSDSAVRAVVRRLEARLGAEPGVLGSGLTSTTPLSNSRRGTSFEIPGRPPARPGERPTAIDQHITPGYFAAMGIRVPSGRGIEWRDAADAPRVAVINRFMAEEVWPGSDPVGRTVTVDSVPWTIVGVVTDVRHGGLDEPVRPEIYRPIEQAVTRAADLEVWTAGDPGAMRDAVRRVVAAVDPGLAIGDVMTMRDMEARHVSVFVLLAGVLSVFAAITMIIAVVGLYGVIAYGVAQRAREIAVRLALGARRGDILRDVAGGAVRLTVIGVALGATGAFAFAQLLRSMLYGVSASDPRTPLVVAGVLLAVAFVAALVPAWRASRVNPAESLRE